MGNILSSVSSTTVLGYSTIGVVLLSSFCYYKYADKQKKAKQHVRLKGRDALTNQPRKEKNAKKNRGTEFANQAKAQPKSYATVTAVQDTNANPAIPAPSKSKDEIDDRAFAQRMANNKQNKFSAKTASEQKHKQKSVKQSQASKATSGTKLPEAKENPKESAPSSIADGDADGEDDQSPITSPSISAADGTGVSDMLEKASAAPSILRLTNTEEKPARVRKAKAPEQTETKKQRQNRQKREQEKAIREEAEKDRKILEGKQRQVARTADNRSAAQKATAWAANLATKTNGVPEIDALTARAPLDTFDDNLDSTTETASKAAYTSPAATHGDDDKENVAQIGIKSDWTDISMSEAQQIKMIEEEEDWKPVETKKAKKAKKTNPGVASSEDGSVNETTASAATASSASKLLAASTNGRPKTQTMATQSSFAALADDGADLEDEPVEWDV